MRRIYFALIISFCWVSLAFSQDYFPLREGNKWEYAMSNGVSMTVQVTGFTDIDGVRCAVVESLTESDMGTQVTKEIMAVDTEGLKVYLSQAGEQEIVYDPPLIRIKVPFIQNQMWTSTLGQGNTGIVTTFQAVETCQISTNIGNFPCIEISSRVNVPGEESMMSESFYSDGIGLIRQDMYIGDQTITAALVSANVKPTEKIGPPPKPAQPKEIICPKCNAINGPSAKFCSECGEKLEATLPKEEPEDIVIDPNDETTFDLFQSSLRKLMLYKPRSWNVAELQYDNGVNVTSVVRPDESALVVFVSFPEIDNVSDSISFSEACIELFQNNIPDLEGDNVKTSSAKDLTTMDISFTEGDSKGVGNAYFFYTDHLGTAFLLLAQDDIWQQVRPTLVNIVSNIAYSPDDIELVINDGKALENHIVTNEQGKILNPASVVQKAIAGFTNEIELVSSELSDKSITMDIPDGWYLDGQNLQFILTDKEMLKNYSMISKNKIIIPTDVTTPGVINETYKTPVEILNYILNYEEIGTEMEILGEVSGDHVNPEIAGEIDNIRKLRYLVDNKLIYVKFKNTITEKISKGIFSVQCITMSIGLEWRYSIDGYWAPEEDFNECLPLFLQISETIQVDKQLAQNDKEKEFQILDQLNRSFLYSIKNSEQKFDEYVEISKNEISSKDYTNWMWSQTTLGQGTWVAQNEGAKVSKSDSWGIEKTSKETDELPYNITTIDNTKEGSQD